MLLDVLNEFVPGLNCILQEMSQRLYIGGLFHGVTEAEVKKRFGKFGSISNISVKTKRDISGNKNTGTIIITTTTTTTTTPNGCSV